jgi:glucose-6-phosphate isomerase
MYFSYFDTEFSNDRILKKHTKTLTKYRAKVDKIVAEHDGSQPEYSLVHAADPAVHDVLEAASKQFKGIKHLVLVGIGGQSLGIEAVHQLLGGKKVQLHVLDTIAPYKLEAILEQLKRIKKVSQIAVCVSSKSGATTEVLSNAGVLLTHLEKPFGVGIYKQSLFIGTAGSTFLQAGKRLQATCVTMPEIVGGRYSVGTEVGLVPLALLGHDVDSFVSGLLEANNEEYEAITADNAARLFVYLGKKYTHYNFFAFEPRLYKLGAWYRQLQAESLGKTHDTKNKKMTKGFVPTLTTAVELHSTGQLHMSGLLPTYTDFVTFDDEDCDYDIPKKGLSKHFGKFNMQEIATAIYGGVIGAYQTKKLPYRATIFTEDLAHSVGLFMGMRMRETMYIAELLGINAFDQPNVDLYKDKTREILGM